MPPEDNPQDEIWNPTKEEWDELSKTELHVFDKTLEEYSKELEGDEHS